MLKLRTMYMDNDDPMHREYVTRMLSAAARARHGPDGLFKLAVIRVSRRSAGGCAGPAWMSCRS